MSLICAKPNKKNKVPSPHDQKCLLASEYSGFKVEVSEIEVGKENKTKEFLAKSPFGTVPVLSVDNTHIYESSLICRYMGSKGSNRNFYPTNSIQVDLMCANVKNFFSNADVIAAAHALVQGKKVGKGIKKNAQKVFDTYLGFFDKTLTSTTFLTGHHITLADTNLFVGLRIFYQFFFEEKTRTKYQSLTRWMNCMANQKPVKKVCGEVKFLTKDVKKQSKFNLEAWKRFYMNNEVPKSIEYFWKNIDRSCNSIWISTYKYGDELEEVFKTSNLMGGVSQRTQPFAKTTFGILLITGSEEKHTIKCLWVYEDTRLPKYVQEGIDFDIYDYKRADWKKDKQLIEEFLNYDAGKVGGEAVLQAKIFR